MRHAAGLVLAVLCALLAPRSAPAQEIEHIVVFPWSVAEGVGEKKSDLLEEVLLGELSTYVPDGIKLVGSSDVQAVLGLEAQKQLTGCDDTSCLVEIGNALGATHIIAPALGLMGDQYVVSAKLLGVQDASVLHRKVLYVASDDKSLLEGVRQIARDLASSQGWSKKGAEPVAATTAPAVAAPPTVAPEEEGPGALLWVGAGLAGLGALAALGLGGGAVALDATAVGDPDKPFDQREQAMGPVLGLAAGSAGGAVIMVAGAVLLAVSLM